MIIKSRIFKWNPFSMFGEMPQGWRFKAEPDEMEFASKEDLEKIKSNPELSKLHQAMLAGVNKKLREIAEKDKQSTQLIESLKGQVAELDAGLQEWENWFINPKVQKVLATAQTSDEEGGGGGGGGGTRKPKAEGNEGIWERKFNQLVESVNQAGKRIEQRFAHQQKLLTLSIELNELYRKNPKLDATKVLAAMEEKGHRSLEDAYNDVYKDEIFNQEIETRLKPRVDEEIQKRSTQVETGSGATPIKFEMPKDLPKSFTEAGQQFLEERVKGAGKEAGKL